MPLFSAAVRNAAVSGVRAAGSRLTAGTVQRVPPGTGVASSSAEAFHGPSPSLLSFRLYHDQMSLWVTNP